MLFRCCRWRWKLDYNWTIEIFEKVQEITWPNSKRCSIEEIHEKPIKQIVSTQTIGYERYWLWWKKNWKGLFIKGWWTILFLFLYLPFENCQQINAKYLNLIAIRNLPSFGCCQKPWICSNYSGKGFSTVIKS